MSADEYESALDKVAADLRAKRIQVMCRGTGMARVLRVTRGNKTVEIAAVANAEEFGFSGRDESTSDLFETLEAAAAETVAWLTGK